MHRMPAFAQAPPLQKGSHTIPLRPETRLEVLCIIYVFLFEQESAMLEENIAPLRNKVCTALGEVQAKPNPRGAQAVIIGNKSIRERGAN